MSAIIELDEAATTLPFLVERAAAGEEIVIAKSGRPLVRLVALPKQVRRRRPSGLLSIKWIADDFDAPLPDDLQAAFEGRDAT
jgi:prevent-host-death family protein